MDHTDDEKDQRIDQVYSPPPAAPAPPGGWKIYPCLLVFVGANLCAICGEALNVLFFHSENIFSWFILSAVLQAAALIGGSYGVAAWGNQQPWRQLGLRSRPLGQIVCYGLLVGTGLYLLTLVINSVLATYFYELVQPQEVVVMMANCPHPLLRWLLVFCVVILAPVGEEIFFRGLLYSAMRRRWGVRWGIVVSGICFGAAHLDWFSLLSFSLVGMALAYLYEKKGSLAFNMVAHGVYNGIATFLLFWLS